MHYVLDNLSYFITAIVAVIGMVITYKTSKQSSKAQLTQTVVQELLMQRIDAFSNLMTAYSEYYFADNKLNAEYIAKLHNAFPRAILLSSPHTAKVIENLREMISSHITDEQRYEALDMTVEAMRNDLTMFSTPKTK